MKNKEEKITQCLLEDERNVMGSEERIGFVVMCAHLNVRQAPSMNAEVLTIIDALDEVLVHGEEETEDTWYCVEANGVVGYCKAEFIELLE